MGFISSGEVKYAYHPITFILYFVTHSACTFVICFLFYFSSIITLIQPDLKLYIALVKVYLWSIIVMYVYTISFKTIYKYDYVEDDKYNFKIEKDTFMRIMSIQN